MKKIKVADTRLLEKYLKGTTATAVIQEDKTVLIDCPTSEINTIFYGISGLKFKSVGVQLTTDTKQQTKVIELFNSER